MFEGGGVSDALAGGWGRGGRDGGLGGVGQGRVGEVGLSEEEGGERVP